MLQSKACSIQKAAKRIWTFGSRPPYAILLVNTLVENRKLATCLGYVVAWKLPRYAFLYNFQVSHHLPPQVMALESLSYLRQLAFAA